MIAAIPIFKQSDGSYSVPSIPFTDHNEIDAVDETAAQLIDVEVQKGEQRVKLKAYDVGLEAICYITFQQYDELV